MSKCSISPISNKEYFLPSDYSAEERRLSEYVCSKEGPVVVVQGLGFVGSAMCLVVANSKRPYKVIGVDLCDSRNFWKIGTFNEGLAPIESSDPKISTYSKQAFEARRLTATFHNIAYSHADIIIVDINLDVQKEYENSGSNGPKFNVDLDPFKKAIKSIGENCKNDCLVLVETTVPPGTCEKIVFPILKDELQKRGLEYNIKLGHSYERVMPGDKYLDSIENFYRVYSGIDKESADAVEGFLRTIIKTDQYPLIRLKNTNASEMAKVMENSYRAVNIAFIDEWTRYAENAKVDLNEVIGSIKMRPTHNNIMKPGIGVGGYCLTKDPLLASWSSKNMFNGHSLQFSELCVGVNDRMPIFSFEKIIQHTGSLNGKRILCMGVSYLGNVGDTRYTPVELMYEKLIGSGALVFFHDPYVKNWNERNLKVHYNKIDDIPFENFDIVIFCTNHSIYKNNKKMLESIKNSKQKIFDFNFCLSPEDVHCLNSRDVFVLGNFFKEKGAT